MIQRSALIALLLITGCAPAHYYRNGFVHDPSLNRFGASLARDGKSIVVKSYIQSSIPLRTEYIYENLDLTFSDDLVPGKMYSMDTKGFAVWFAKGGQAGQIETKKARGSITVKSLTADKAVLECDLEFYSFSMKGHYMKAPNMIIRKGILTAKKGYVLYP